MVACLHPVVVAVTFIFYAERALALKHTFSTRHDARHLIGPVGVPFGFLEGGEFRLNVRDFKLDTTTDLKLLEPGFWLQRFPNEASFQHYLNELQANVTGCAFEHFRAGTDGKHVHEVEREPSAQPYGLFLSLKEKSDWKDSTIDYTFKEDEEGLYFLIYQVCAFTKKPPKVLSKFHVDFHFVNYDSFGHVSYLTAGEMNLPVLFTLSGISFTLCALLWHWNLQRIRKGQIAILRSKEEQTLPPGVKPTIYAIHPIMDLLIWVKAMTVWAEAFRFHAIKISGHAEAWTVLYYTLYFFRGTFLFTVILLIGTGWSFVKGVLNNREKQFIFLVLFLQMINQVALIVLSQDTEGERGFGSWNAVLHLVDIICCCAVLLPIVWQVNAMEASLKAQQFDDDSVISVDSRVAIVEKLKIFRLFYLLVIAYIYATRIVVYLFATLLDFKHLWIRHAVVELVTLVFYVTVGLLFRPRVEKRSSATMQADGENEEENEGIALMSQSASV